MIHILILNHKYGKTQNIQEALRRVAISAEFLLADTLEDFQSIITNTPVQLTVIASNSVEAHGIPMQALIIARELNPGIPLLIFTGESDCRNAMQYIRAGASDYIHAADLNQLFMSSLHIIGENESVRKHSSVTEVLVRAGRQWRATFDAMQDSVCVTDDRGLIIRANHAFRDFLGLSWQEIINRNFHDLSGIESGPEATGNQAQEMYFTRNEHWYRLSTVRSLQEDGQGAETIRIISDISYSRQLEKSLLESESRHLKFFNKLPLGVLYQDLSGKIITANASAEDILGIPARELVGKDLPDLGYSKEDGTRSLFLLQGDEFFQLLNEGKAVKDKILGFTHRISGKHRWIKINAIPFKSEDSPSADLAAYIIEDITEEKNAVEKVRSTAAQLNTIFRSVPITMIILDARHIIREINLPLNASEPTATEHLIGTGKSSLIKCINSAGEDLSCGDHPECSACQLRETVSRTIEEQQEFNNIEVEIKSRKGNTETRENYLIHTSPIIYEDEPMCLLVLNDISEIKQSQRALEKSVIELKSAQKKLKRHAKWVRTLNDFSRSAAEEQNFQALIDLFFHYLDKSLEHSFGLLTFQKETPEELEVEALSRHDDALRQFFTPGMLINAADFPKVLTESGSSKIIEITDISDGKKSEIWQGVLEVLQSKKIQAILKIPFALSEMKTAFLYLAFTNRKRLKSDEWRFLNNLIEFLSLSINNWRLYSELDQSYEQLSQVMENMSQQRRMEAMGQLASGITHDINNALVPILLYTESLLALPDGNMDTRIRYLKSIQNAAQDIEHVAKRMRAFYQKNDSGETQEVSVDTLFDEVIDLTRPLWQSSADKKGKHIDVVKKISGNPVLMVNQSDLRESLTNMLINSCDSIETNGSICLNAEQKDGYTVLTVEDSGKGMDAETVQRCMEPFFSTKGVDGTGLGLPAVFGMIQRYNGSMEIDSKPGEGTRIQLRFPITAPEASAELPSTSEAYPEGLKILLTEDDERVLPVLKEMLQIDRHKVFSASSGGEALEILKSELEKGVPFQVLVTDYGMANINGLQLAAMVKKTQPDIPIILLTGWGVLMQDDETPENIDVVLSKPPKLDLFRKSIGALILNRNIHNKGESGK